MAAARPPPSLLSLCLEAVASHLSAGAAAAGGWGGRDDRFGGAGGGGEEDGGHLVITPEEAAGALPWELLHRLASRLPAVALESLHHAAHDRCCSSVATTAVGFGGPDGDRRGIKRSMCEDFNPEWQELFRHRWLRCDNAGHDSLIIVDWQQQYWEKHLQECLDEAAESALLPSFCGTIDELTISAQIMGYILHGKDIPQQYSRLSYHCSRFGCYTRCLRLQSVLCTAEIAGLLQVSKLETLMFVRIISELEVNGVCMLLSCHAETLLSLEFIHCQLSPAVMDKICNSTLQKGSVNHGIQNFSLKSSRICDSNPLNISAGLLDFLSLGKSLHLLSLNDTKMQPSFAKMIVHTLLESSSGIQTIEISENNIAGWLKTVDKRFASFSASLESNICLNSLTLLNLRSNNLNKSDIEDLCKILVKMPNLRDLDISDNPIMDEGIRLLICFISRNLQKEKSLWRLRAENCDLTNIGVTELLECLSSGSESLNLLSIADNHLGSSVAAALGKFLGSGIRELNIEDIDLGPLGFQILEEALPPEVAISHINISKNRGGIRAAHFVSRLIQQAPGLVSVNSGSNLLPPESLEVICNALKQNKCNLERLDLMGNVHLSDAVFPAALEFRKHGKQILIVPSHPCACAPYDDDPGMLPFWEWAVYGSALLEMEPIVESVWVIRHYSLVLRPGEYRSVASTICNAIGGCDGTTKVCKWLG